MWGHVSEERLIEVLEGTADAATRAHAEACGRCGRRIESLRDGLALAHEAGVFPEPPAVYWEALRRQIDRRIAGDSAAWSWGFRPALATAAALVALLAVAPASRLTREPLPSPAAPLWSPLPPVSEDTSFALLQSLGAAEEDVAAASARQGIAGVVSELSEAERQRLADALQSELRGKKS